ncbi:hypothetical protein C8Q74DRAFT_704324 [Fomes fomentarius]|nr:hypothetical protein C8Q74DRAFT_704324 [Fomes fomentarius]
MNVNKRKHDAANSPEAAATSSGPSGSRASASPISSGSRNAVTSLPASLPPRPSAATVASAGIGGAPSAPRAERQRDRQFPPHLKGKAPRSSPSNSGALPTEGPSADGTSVPGQAEPESPRSAKRSRIDGGRGQTSSGDGASGASMSRTASQRGGKAGEPPAVAKVQGAKPVPSLLSRLAGELTSGQATAAVAATPERERDGQGQGQGRRNKRERDSDRESDFSVSTTLPTISAKRRADPTIAASRSAPSSKVQSVSGPPKSDGSTRQPRWTDPDKDPVVGFSIRGAAKAANRSTGGEGSGGKGPGSLLERMQAQGDGNGPGADGPGRRRKRTKH